MQRARALMGRVRLNVFEKLNPYFMYIVLGGSFANQT